MRRPLTVLCIASYRKGDQFLVAAKRTGAKVLLLTSKSLEESDWPRESIDELYFMPDVEKKWNMPDVIKGVSWLARSVKIDRVVALDDFDVEKAAAIREHLRIAGMGDTTARYFRDKLAMRTKAREAGLVVHAASVRKVRFTARTTPAFPGRAWMRANTWCGGLSTLPI